MADKISLGGELFDVVRMGIPMDNIIPNPDQPRAVSDRAGDQFLYRGIRENRGIPEPLLVEKMPKEPDKVRIIDGERRWTTCKKLLAEVPEAKGYASSLPCDVIQQELTREQRLRIWIYIHRTRLDWNAIVKDKTVLDVVDLVGRNKTADILGWSIKKVDDLIDDYQLAQRMEGTVGRRAISYARETRAIPKKYLDHKLTDTIVEKVNRGLIKDSVAIRELPRKILKDSTAKEEFLKPRGTIESALAAIKEALPEPEELKTPKVSIKEFRTLLAGYSIGDYMELKGDGELIAEIDDCIQVLNEIKETLIT